MVLARRLILALSASTVLSTACMADTTLNGPIVFGSGFTVVGNRVTTVARKTNPVGGFFIEAGGSNSNDCLSATVTGGHGPCLTGQYVASLIMSEYDPVGRSFIVHVGPGLSFNWTTVVSGNLGAAYGSSGVAMVFVGAGKANTKITASGGGCPPFGHPFTGTNGASIGIGSMTISTSCAGGSDLFGQSGAYFFLYDGDVAFGAAPNGQHIHLEDATFELSGGIGYHVSGAAVSHYGAQSAFITIGPDVLPITIDGAYNFPGGFALLQDASVLTVGQDRVYSFSGVTGERAVAQGLSVISLLGQNSSTSAAFLPGNGPVKLESGSVMRPQPVPVLGAKTGLGTGGTGVLSSNSSNAGGTIVLTSGSGSTATSGTVVLELTTNPQGYEPRCGANLGPGWSGITAASVSVSAVTAGTATSDPLVTLKWATNGAVLPTASSFDIGYGCSQS